MFENRKNSLMKSYLSNNENKEIVENLKKFNLLSFQDFNLKILCHTKLDDVIAVFNENIKRLKNFFLIFNENPNPNNAVINDSEFESQLNNIKNMNEFKDIISKNSFL